MWVYDKMKRQAIALSIKELKKLIKLFEREEKEIKKLLGRKQKGEIKHQVNIVNYPTSKGKRTIYCSDTWEIEK